MKYFKSQLRLEGVVELTPDQLMNWGGGYGSYTTYQQPSTSKTSTAASYKPSSYAGLSTSAKTAKDKPKVSSTNSTKKEKPNPKTKTTTTSSTTKDKPKTTTTTNSSTKKDKPKTPTTGTKSTKKQGSKTTTAAAGSSKVKATPPTTTTSSSKKKPKGTTAGMTGTSKEKPKENPVVKTSPTKDKPKPPLTVKTTPLNEKPKTTPTTKPIPKPNKPKPIIPSTESRKNPKPPTSPYTTKPGGKPKTKTYPFFGWRTPTSDSNPGQGSKPKGMPPQTQGEEQTLTAEELELKRRRELNMPNQHLVEDTPETRGIIQDITTFHGKGVPGSWDVNKPSCDNYVEHFFKFMTGIDLPEIWGNAEEYTVVDHEAYLEAEGALRSHPTPGKWNVLLATDQTHGNTGHAAAIRITEDGTVLVAGFGYMYDNPSMARGQHVEVYSSLAELKSSWASQGLGWKDFDFWDPSLPMKGNHLR